MRVLAAAALLLLAACSSAPSETDPSPSPAPPPSAASRPPAPDTASRDQCGAAALQGMVGKSRTEIPVAIDPARQRVACTACPVTADFNPERLNFFFDAATGIIKEVRCG